MSPLAAILSWTGARSDLTSDVERMMSAASGAKAHRASIVRTSECAVLGIHLDGEGSIGHVPRLATTPDRRLWLVLDGSLHNGRELQAALGCGEGSARSASDADLCLACLERWGEAALQRFVGPYAFILIDTLENTILCARDPSTLHPLFFHHEPGRSITVASEGSQLLSLPQVPRDPDDLIVAEFLVGRPHADPRRSFLRDLQRVPGGHVLIAGEDRLSVKRFWLPTQAAQRTWSSEEDCFSSGRTIFRDAVERALPSDGRSVFLLSGGYDSAAVAGVLDELRSPGGSDDVTAVHVGFEGSSCDESAFVDATLRRFPLPFRRLAAAPLSYDEVVGAAHDRAWAPISSPIFLFPRVASALRGEGACIALSGDGGDELFSNAGVESDLMRRRSYLKLARLIWHENPLGINTAFRLQLLAGRLLRMWAGRGGVARPRRSLGLRPYPAPLLQETVDLLSRPQAIVEDEPPPLPSTVQQETWRRLVGGIDQDRGIEARAIDARRSGLEYCCPFLDRRLMEWALSVPFEWRVDVRQFKALLVRSMGRYLPEAIVRRNRKTRYTEYWARCVGALGTSFQKETLDRPEWRPARYLDREAVRDHFRTLLSLPPQDLPSRGDDLGVLLAWRTIAVDLWLRSLDSRPASTVDRASAIVSAPACTPPAVPPGSSSPDVALGEGR